MKFMRRKDLDTQTRIQIVILALLNYGTYGAMSRLAQHYDISRTFLYQMVGVALFYLTMLFNIEEAEISSDNVTLTHLIVLLRLEGKCSISGISSILDFQGLNPCSTGTISQYLKYYGANLPSTLSAPEPCHVIFLSDEIFANGQPILVTLEPKSTAMLKIELATNRSADTWENHFKELFYNQFHSIALSSDRGKGLTKGYKQAYLGKPWYSDHFHELKPLLKLLIKFEKQAYAAINQEQECLRKFDNAVSEKNLQKRLIEYEKAVEVCCHRIVRYDTYVILVHSFFSSLNFFDEKGAPRSKEQALVELQILLDLISVLEERTINDATLVLRTHLDDIVLCFEQVQEVYHQLSLNIPKNALDFICLAWQYNHQTSQTKSNYLKDERDSLLSWAEPIIGTTFEEAQSIIIEAFERLDSMVRASSLVEMVNGQIRPYLNSCKGQITQETLNLIMFYHNHRRYKDGKRQGKAPIEILTGQTLNKHWVELLFESLPSP